MLAYKQYANIDSQGTLVLQNLPFRNYKFVEVVVLINDLRPNLKNTEEKLKRIKASFGTIKSKVLIEDSALSRENMYGEDGR